MLKKIFFIVLSCIIFTTYINPIYIYAEDQSTNQYRDQQITVGYTPGYNKVVAEYLIELLEVELDLDVLGVEYSDIIYLKEAVGNGEVDIASGLVEDNIESSLYYSKSIFREYKIVVTTLEHQIYKIDELVNMKVGFLSSDRDYAESFNSAEDKNLEIVYFDTLDEVEQALSNNEVDAFICSDYYKDFIVDNPSFISRITLNDIPSAYRFATSQSDMHQLIDLINNMMNTRLYDKIFQYEDDYTKEYLMQHYPYMDELPQQITVNTLANSFPNSYVDEDGHYVGYYVDMLEFFTESTGITYSLQGNEFKSYSEILESLNEDSVQIAIGFQSLLEKENVMELSTLYFDDYLITIQNKNKENNATLDDLRIGVSEELEEYAFKNGFHDIKVYNTTMQAIAGLKKDEIDVLITYKSVLDYYQQIKGESSLNQSNFILMEYPKTIMVNKNNEKFNKLFQDVLRIYITLGVGDPETDNDIVSTNYFNSYLELKDKQTNYAIYSAIITVIVGILFIRSALRRAKAHRKLEYKYKIDELTGIYNRNSYKDKVKSLILGNQNKFGTYIFIDLNYFKCVNDTYGHNNGDIVLIEFAKGLKSFENNRTISFRIAGDEFGIYACGFDTLPELESFVEKVATYPFGEIELNEGSRVTVKYSLGYAIYPLHSTNIEKLHEYADFAMYKAKENKDRNEFNCQVYGFNKQLYETKYPSTIKIDEITSVINENDIHITYQPILNIENGDLVGYEGIASTNNNKFIDWQDFKSHVIKANLQQVVDELVFENIIKNFNITTNLYMNIEDRDMVSVNHQVLRILKKYDKEHLGGQIVLEIADKNELGQFGFTSIHRLLSEHILDSTDYTNNKTIKLKRLLTMYPKVVKISRSLFEEIEDDYGELEFLKMLVEFSDEHGFELLCDGIESREDLVLMKSLGVKYGKGSYLCDPDSIL